MILNYENLELLGFIMHGLQLIKLFHFGRKNLVPHFKTLLSYAFLSVLTKT